VLLRRYSVVNAALTYLLLISGGLVSVMEAGMACGFDWPLCQGEYIPRMMDGKQYEHPHRLTAMFVGVMTYGLCALLLKYRRQDRLLVRMGVAAAILVTVQALLGALTVKMALPWYVSSTHQATAMGFFCLMVSLAFLIRQRDGAPSPRAAHETRNRLARLIGPVALLAYAQVIAGAVMRHTRGGLACGFDFPKCLGSWWPLGEHAGVQAHMVHRALGLILGVAVIAMTVGVWRTVGAPRALRLLSLAACVGVVAQIGLGIATLLTSRDLVVMTVHSSVGAALLAGLVSMFWVARPVKGFQPVVDAATPDASLGLRSPSPYPSPASGRGS
jgi:cytochrome c oxidase assembly protein subunit 15